jgi:hypothetical protein
VRPFLFSKNTCQAFEGAQEARRSTRAQGCALGEHTVREEQGVSLVTFFAPAKKVTRSRSE